MASPYVCEYLDGPLEGAIERRLLDRGQHQHVLDTVVTVDGVPAVIRYRSSTTRTFGDDLWVSYRFDPTGSDPHTQETCR